MLKKLKSTAGFSIAEMLVTISIIAIMTGTFTVNYHNANEKTGLIMGGQKLVSDIRLAQNNTLGLAPFSSSIASSSWGVYFNTADNKQYIMFSDLNDNKQYDSGEMYRTYSLPPNVSINNLYITKGTEGSVSSLSIIFYPPDPEMYFNQESILENDGTAPEKAKIYLADKTGNTRSVIVNFFGSIDIQ